MGELRLVAPPELMPGCAEPPGAVRCTEADAGLADADVVMAGIQKERMSRPRSRARAFRKRYGISRNRLALARPDAIVMHPGPMNRDVEIESDVADGPQSVIRTQVANGVAVRMAVLLTLAEHASAR